MNRDRIALLAAYLLLVGVVAWLSFSVGRSLDQVKDDVCATAEIAVANELATLVILADESVPSETVERVLTEYVALADTLRERCGTTYLDLVD